MSTQAQGQDFDIDNLFVKRDAADGERWKPHVPTDKQQPQAEDVDEEEEEEDDDDEEAVQGELEADEVMEVGDAGAVAMEADNPQAPNEEEDQHEENRDDRPQDTHETESREVQSNTSRPSRFSRLSKLSGKVSTVSVRLKKMLSLTNNAGVGDMRLPAEHRMVRRYKFTLCGMLHDIGVAHGLETFFVHLDGKLMLRKKHGNNHWRSDQHSLEFLIPLPEPGRAMPAKVNVKWRVAVGAWNITLTVGNTVVPPVWKCGKETAHGKKPTVEAIGDSESMRLSGEASPDQAFQHAVDEAQTTETDAAQRGRGDSEGAAGPALDEDQAADRHGGANTAGQAERPEHSEAEQRRAEDLSLIASKAPQARRHYSRDPEEQAADPGSHSPPRGQAGAWEAPDANAAAGAEPGARNDQGQYVAMAGGEESRVNKDLALLQQPQMRFQPPPRTEVL